MAVLHSVLAAYGAFDQVAVQTQDPELRAAVEKLLPGTTGPGQRGWFAQIQNFVRQRAREQAERNGTDVAAAEAAAEFPSLEQAVTEIRSAGPDSPEMTHRVKQRLLFAGLGLTALKSLQVERSTSVPVLNNLNLTMFNDLFSMAANPLPMSGTEPDSSGSSGSNAAPLPQLLDVLKDSGADGWAEVMAAAANAEQPAVPPEVAATPPIKAIGESVVPEVRHQITENGVTRHVTDQSKVTSEVIQMNVQDNDILCSLLTTEFTRTPWDISRVTGIIDPLNWDNANKFFAEMTDKGLAADNRSSQILEEVSTDPSVYRIKTKLKYVKEERPGDNFVINYDFADSRGDDDSLQVHVDSGYIVVSPTADGGVRVQTSKMVAMDGLSPTAVAIFAHAMGWVSIGEMMMFGDPTNDPRDPIIPWKKSPDPSTASALINRSAPDQTPRPPQPVSQIFVKETTKAVAEYVNIATKETAVIADKWIKGDLSLQDMVDHTTKLGGKLASEPFRILDRLMKNAAGQASDGASTDQARGGGSQ